MLLLEHEPPQFSEAYGQSGGLLSISPSGRLVAVAAQHRLLVRDVETQQVVQAFSHDGEVGHAEWSCDSLYVLAVLRGRGLCHVWAVNDAEWYCKVDEGPLGLAHARWAPDGRHVLTSSCHGVRLTVWSLLDRSVCYVRAPKLPVAGVAFSADGRWLAVAERREGADWLGVYECAAGYERACAFEVATHDLASVAWAPAAAGLGAAGTEASSADWLLVTDGCMQLCALVYRRDGQLIAKLQHDEGQAPLGARLGAWAPAGNMVAVGSYAGEVRVLVARTCHCVAQLCHPSTLRGFPRGGLGAPPLVFAEALLDGEEPRAEGAGGAGRRAKSAASQLQELAESLPHLRALTRPTRFEPRHLSAAPGGGLRLPTASAADEREQALPKIGAQRARGPRRAPARARAAPSPATPLSPSAPACPGVRTLEWSPDGRYLATQLEEMPAVLWLWEAASFR